MPYIETAYINNLVQEVGGLCTPGPNVHYTLAADVWISVCE